MHGETPASPAAAVDLAHSPNATDDDRDDRDDRDPRVSGGPSARAPIHLGTLVVVGAVVAAVRWWFLRDRRSVHLAPDEPGQLAMARWLARGPHWNMFDHSTWRPGPATLFAPVYWFTDDGATVVRGALSINAVVAGISAIVLARLTHRLTSLPRPASAAIAVAIALSPTSIMSSAYVWAEPLAMLAFVTTVWYIVRFHDSGGATRPAIAAVLWSVVGFTAHSRLLPTIATTVLVTVGTLAWRRRWRPAIVVAVIGLAGTAASTMYARLVRAAVWESPGNINTSGTVLKRLKDPLAVGEALLGQVWYQLVATGGLVLLGALVIGRAALRRRDATISTISTDTTDTTGTGTYGAHHTAVPIDPWTAVALSITTLAPIAVSAAFMSQRGRADQLVYGRYNDAVLWPVVAIGAGWLVRRAIVGFRRRDLWAVAAVAVSVVATGAWVEAVHGEILNDDVGLRQMVSGLLPYVGDADAVPVVRITLTALALFAVAVVAVVAIGSVGRRARIAAIVVSVVAATALLGFAGVRTRHAQSLRVNTWARAEVVREIDDLVPPGVELGVSMVPDREDPTVTWERQRQRYQLYQLYLPGHRFERDRGPDDSVGPYVFAPTDDPTLTEAGATVLWVEPGEKIALWLEPIEP